MDLPLLQSLTDFADQAVVLPLTAGVAAVLLLQKRCRVAAAWLLSVAGVLAVVLALKLLLAACGPLLASYAPSGLRLHNPSGHAASAGVAWAGIAALQSRHTGLPPLRLAVAASLLAAALIGATRLALGAHTGAEVALAAILGAAGAATFAATAGPSLQARSGLPILAVALLIVLAMHGLHLPAEPVIQDAGRGWLRSLIQACTAT